MLKKELITRLSETGIVGRTEADIQSDIQSLLMSGKFGLSPARLEVQVGDGTKRRIDIAIGATVIEVKRELTSEENAVDYVAQLDGYVQSKTSQEGTRYNGILTDGRQWWLYETVPGTDGIRRRSTFELSSADRGDDLISWLQAVLATRKDIRPTQETIETFLGSTSPAYEQDHAYLEGLYRQVSHDPTVQLKRELWTRLLRSALGTSFDDQQDGLFLDHTLLVIEAAAIGHAIMGISLADLAADPARMIRGDEFENAAIYNVVESDFFDWILADEDGKKFITHIIRRVSVFNWSETEHDVLKVLYESVINAATRKGMGEYYTPDWLAEGIVEKTVTEPLKQRVLDPACGSGTFVFHAIRRVLDAADKAGWDNRTALNHIQGHVFGLDIHPVSVVLARVTYLLALGDRLQGDRDGIYVPVHLGDSMQWYQPADHEEQTIKVDPSGVDLTSGQKQATLFDIGEVLAFPLADVEDPATFDRLVTAMTDKAKTYTDGSAKKPDLYPILQSFGIPEFSKDWKTLQDTFNILCDLNAIGRDSIWGYFVRNQVRPLWLSMKNRRVDVLIGNPPWVAYRYMTEAMQKQFKAFSEERKLWHGFKVATHQDLVGLFITRSVEKYLHDGGSFGFVTPLAVLSRQQYEGFRTGNWGEYLRGEVTEAWDLEKVRPKNDLFPVPAAVIFGLRHDFNPHDYAQRMKPPAAGFPEEKMVVEGIRDKRGWMQTKVGLTFAPIINRALTSDEASLSPYRSTLFNGATVFPQVLFFVAEEDSTNKLGQAAGRVNVRSERSMHKPWKDLEPLSGVVPRRFIYDVHLGTTTAPFRPLKPRRAVLPIEREALLTEKEIEDGDPLLAEWWREASKIWETYKTRQSKLSLLANLNYQNKITKQMGGATHRVVYSASGNTLAAARLDDPRQIVEHKLYWLPARSVSEARYLTAILNAPIITELVSDYQSRGLFGARDFDTYVWRLPIPTYNTVDKLHERIAELGAEAELIAAKTEIEGCGFQKARKIIRDALSKAELTQKLNAAVSQLIEENGAP